MQTKKDLDTQLTRSSGRSVLYSFGEAEEEALRKGQRVRCVSHSFYSAPTSFRYLMGLWDGSFQMWSSTKECSVSRRYKLDSKGSSGCRGIQPRISHGHVVHSFRFS